MTYKQIYLEAENSLKAIPPLDYNKVIEVNCTIYKCPLYDGVCGHKSYRINDLFNIAIKSYINKQYGIN